MPSVSHQSTIPLDTETIWRFLNNFSNWAACMPGYQGFTQIDPDRSVWLLRGDVGIFQRLVEFRVTVARRTAPSQIEFLLEAPGEGVKGEGAYRGLPAPGGTEVAIELGMEGSGMAKPVMDLLLGQMLKRDVPRLVAEVSRRLAAANGAGEAL